MLTGRLLQETPVADPSMFVEHGCPELGNLKVSDDNYSSTNDDSSIDTESYSDYSDFEEDVQTHPHCPLL